MPVAIIVIIWIVIIIKVIIIVMAIIVTLAMAFAGPGFIVVPVAIVVAVLIAAIAGVAAQIDMHIASEPAVSMFIATIALSEYIFTPVNLKRHMGIRMPFGQFHGNTATGAYLTDHTAIAGLAKIPGIVH